MEVFWWALAGPWLDGGWESRVVGSIEDPVLARVVGLVGVGLLQGSSQGRADGGWRVVGR